MFLGQCQRHSARRRSRDPIKLNQGKVLGIEERPEDRSLQQRAQIDALARAVLEGQVERVAPARLRLHDSPLHSFASSLRECRDRRQWAPAPRQLQSRPIRLLTPGLGKEFLPDPAQFFHVNGLLGFEAVDQFISDWEEAQQRVEVLCADLAP